MTGLTQPLIFMLAVVGLCGCAGLPAQASVDQQSYSPSQRYHLIDKPTCEVPSTRVEPRPGRRLAVAPSGLQGQVVLEGRRMSFRQLLQGAQAGDTFLLADGEYTFDSAVSGGATGLFIRQKNITLRGQSGDPRNVILDSEYKQLGYGSGLVTVAAPDFTLADLTLRRSLTHLLHIKDQASGLRVHNVLFEDGGQQFVKASGADQRVQIDAVQIACSRFVLSQSGRDNIWGYGDPAGYTRCYTGGIDAHRATNWRIVDNHFEGIYCHATRPHPVHGKTDRRYTGGLAEHAIHLWHSDLGSQHVIERNRIVNCARGIGIGMMNRPQKGAAVVRNNMISSVHAQSTEHDVGIIVEAVAQVVITQNSVAYTHPRAYRYGIEYRYPVTVAEVANNLLTGRERARAGASAVKSGNVESVPLAYFVSPATGDLQLSAQGLQADGLRAPLHRLAKDDFNGATRAVALNRAGADRAVPADDTALEPTGGIAVEN